MKTVAFVSSDAVGKAMAGPGIRYFELAKQLSQHKDFKVILLVPSACDIDIRGIEVREYCRKNKKSLIRGFKGAEVVIAQEMGPPVLRYIKKNNIKYIADLYDPLIIELLEYHRFAGKGHQKNAFLYTYRNLMMQLHYADHILCASEEQKSLYIGIMTGARLFSAAAYHSDPAFANFISLTPFGMSSSALPQKDKFNFYKKFPGIKKQDKVVLWGGGVWNWFDAMSVVRAMEHIARRRQDIKLVFMGLKHPSPHVKVMEMAQRALEYCREKNLLDKYVFFNFEWTPYEDRAVFLRHAYLGISTHFDNLETRFAFRTRILDYLWSELPIVTTRGDAMADLVERNGLGVTVDFEDVSGIAKAITDLVDDPRKYDAAIVAIKKVKPQFFWKNIAANIVDVIDKERFTSRPLGLLQQCRLVGSFYWSAFKERYLG